MHWRFLVGLLIGSSTTARSGYMRNAASDAIYDLAINNFQLPADYGHWQQKRFFSSAIAKVKKIKFGNRIFTPEGSEQASRTKVKWQADNLPDGKMVSEIVADEAFSSLINLSFDKVLKAKPTDGKKRCFGVSIVHDRGERDYAFYRQDTKDNKARYALKASDGDEYFEVLERMLGRF